LIAKPGHDLLGTRGDIGAEHERVGTGVHALVVQVMFGELPTANSVNYSRCCTVAGPSPPKRVAK
jgi:hypothetical protein